MERNRIINRIIKRAELKANRDKKIYLFGDNLVEKGFGGQAKEMRGEPNAYGIPTKKYPTMESKAFFTDSEYELNKRRIDKAIEKVPLGKEIVVPTIGVGLAKLPQKAPKTYKYLQLAIKRLLAKNESVMNGENIDFSDIPPLVDEDFEKMKC